MRSRILNRIPLSYPTVHLRSFVQATAQAKEPAIFENSLEKTLAVHRSTNRRSLIRRVVARTDNTKQTPPTLAAKESAGTDLPESYGQSSSSTQPATAQNGSDITRKSKRPTGHRNRRRSASASVFAFSSIDWRVKTGKPKQCPWIDAVKPGQRFTDGIPQLYAEIASFEKYLAPSPLEKEAVERVTTEVTNLILNNAKLLKTPHVIHTGLVMSHSILDVIFTLSEEGSMEGTTKPIASHTKKLRRYREILDLARRSLGQHPTYKLSLNKRQRTLAVLHKPTGLVLRISCAGEEPARIEYLRDFHAEYPTLLPLYMTTRLILETRGLFGTAKSCIDSTDLQVLIAAFLKINHGRFRRDDGCAESLLAFLRTFGTEVDLTSTGVSTDPPGYFNADTVEQAYATHNPEDVPAHLRGQRTLINTKKTALKRGNRPLATGLLIQDPGNYMRQLGSSCSRTIEMQAAFADAHERLKNALDAWKPAGYSTPGTSILGSVLRANFDGFAARRNSIISGSRTT